MMYFAYGTVIVLKFSIVCSLLFDLIQFDFNFLVYDIARISLSKDGSK